MSVYSPPRARGLQPEVTEAGHYDHVLSVVKKDVVVVIVGERKATVHPRQHDENVEEEPPAEEQTKVQVAETELQFAAREMGPQSERSHHGDAAEEEHDVDR